MKFKKILVLGVLLFLLAACQKGGNAQAPAVSKPDAGKATVTGRILSLKTGKPLANMGMRLAEVVRQGGQGAYVLDTAGSPGAYTDDNGYFVFKNITPEDYVMVVGDVMNTYVIVPDQSGKPRVWNAPIDQVTQYGDIHVDLAPPASAPEK
ncbi:MAG: hypothetical protein ACM3PY_02245 [Omnitrophica WOR_2 bacterium]